jgi:hypothetical protein
MDSTEFPSPWDELAGPFMPSEVVYAGCGARPPPMGGYGAAVRGRDRWDVVADVDVPAQVGRDTDRLRPRLGSTAL